MKRKFVAMMLAVACITTSLAGCGGGSSDGESQDAQTSAGDEAGDEAEASDEGGSGDVHMTAFGSTYDNMVETAELFNSQEGHSGKVIIDQSDDSYSTVIPALVAGTGVPDMIEIQSREPAQFYLNYGTESFVDLTDIIEPVDEWVEHDVECMKAEDGKYYAMPWNVGPCGLYYRTDVFEECGIDPESIETWDDLVEAGIKIKEQTGMYTIASTTNGTHCDDLMMLINQQGGQYYDEEGKVDFNTPEMLKAAEIFQKFVDNDLIYECPNIWDDRIKAVNDEKIATVPYAVWYAGTMYSACEEQAGKWKITSFPAVEEGGNTMVNMGGSAVLVSSTSQNIELCKEFLTFAMKSVEGNEINTKWGSFPAYKPSYEEDYFHTEDEYFQGQKINEYFSTVVDAPVTDFGPAFRDVQDQLKLACGELFKEGADKEAILESYSEKAQSIIDAKQ